MWNCWPTRDLPTLCETNIIYRRINELRENYGCPDISDRELLEAIVNDLLD